MIMKAKRAYVRPMTMVVELREKCQILAGSGSERTAPVNMSVTYEEEEI